MVIPGEIIADNQGDIELNTGKNKIRLLVKNKGDRPVQIGSHAHFFEVNKHLEFDREKSYGYRLNIPAGTAVRFEPGEVREVELVEIGGSGTIYGFNQLVMGDLREKREEAIKKAKDKGYINEAK